MNRLETDQFVLGYTEQKITPYAGLVLLKNFLDKIRFRDVASKWHLPQPKSNRGYNPVQILEQMVVSVWARAENYSQTDISRSDPVIQWNFWATEAGLTTNVWACNLMSLFRQVVLRLKSQPKLSRIQKNFIYIAGIF